MNGSIDISTNNTNVCIIRAPRMEFTIGHGNCCCLIVVNVFDYHVHKTVSRPRNTAASSGLLHGEAGFRLVLLEMFLKFSVGTF